LPNKEFDRFSIGVAGPFQFDASMWDGALPLRNFTGHATFRRKINDESEEEKDFYRSDGFAMSGSPSRGS
jgi:hypothetical protein